MRALVLGVTTLALSAGAASAQAPAQEVYPGYGYAPYGYSYAPYGYSYAPYGYGYAAPAPLYNYSAPEFGYSGRAFGPATMGQPSVAGGDDGYGYAAPAPLHNYTAPAYGYSAPAYGPATMGQPSVAAGDGSPAAESIPTQITRHHRSMYMSAGDGSTQKKGALKTGATNRGY